MLLKKGADVVAIRAKLRSGCINMWGWSNDLRYLNGQARQLSSFAHHERYILGSMDGLRVVGWAGYLE